MLTSIRDRGVAGYWGVKVVFGVKALCWVGLAAFLCLGTEAAAETQPKPNLTSHGKETFAHSRSVKSPASKIDYEFFKSSEMAFTCLMPKGWETRKMANGDLLVKPINFKKGPEFSIKIRLQKPEGQPPLALTRKIEESGKQFLRAPKGRILKQNKTIVAGKKAPYLVVAYRALDKKGKPRAFAHALVAFLRQDKIMQIDYSGPYEVYQGNLAYFQGFLDSLRLLPLKP
jgi:hypothetical protein